MPYGIRLKYEPIRSLAFGDISANYASVGTGANDTSRVVFIKNNTDADLMITIVDGKGTPPSDGSVDMIFMAANSMQVTDLATNQVNRAGLLLPRFATFWARHLGAAPTTGALYVELLSAAGGAGG